MLKRKAIWKNNIFVRIIWPRNIDNRCCLCKRKQASWFDEKCRKCYVIRTRTKYSFNKHIKENYTYVLKKCL